VVTVSSSVLRCGWAATALIALRILGCFWMRLLIVLAWAAGIGAWRFSKIQI